MSGNGEEEKSDSRKNFPLDLAAKISTIKTIETKTPVIMTQQPLRGMRLLAQTVTTSVTPTPVSSSSITATNLVPQTIIKGDTQIGLLSTTHTSQSSASVTIQRPTQITLATNLPLVAQNVPTGTYHVPRGPAVVANLAAPRSNVATAIRTPMVVAAQTNTQQTFTRPPRTPSPAQGTAWLTTNSSNGSQIKGAPTVLSTPVRGATVSGTIGKPPRTQTVAQNISTIRPATATILHSTIAIGQGGQIHPFKSGQVTGTIPTHTVTLAQVVPSRTQTLVYSTGSAAHFTSSPRITIASTNQRQTVAPKPTVTTARLAVPVSQTTATRLVAPQGTVLTTTRIPTTQPTVIGGTSARIVTNNQTNVTLGRLSVSVTAPPQVATANILAPARISTLSLHPLVAVGTQTRTIPTQGAKVITQSAQGTAIHLAQMPATIKSTQNIVTTSARTINVQPATIVAQRQGNIMSSQTIPIAKVFPHQGDNQQGGTTATANVFIHAPVASIPRRASPGPVITQVTTNVTTTVATYSIAGGTYFYDASGNYTVARSFTQQPTTFATLQPTTNQQIRPSTLNTQVHGIVANQQMRFNPVMVVEQNRVQSFTPQADASQEQPQQVAVPTKMTSSPRPSILRKRDHEGSPLKAVKNLTPTLTAIPHPALSPPPRPDSGGNGNSSGGSTTISATSSPGLAETNEDSLPHVPIKEEEENRPPIEMSPRKKPRKQQLTGNDLDENKLDFEDIQFISESTIKKEPDSDGNHSDAAHDEIVEPRRIICKPASASLLNSYRQTWKATHNHYLRYSDVRPKEERRPTIMDLSNQCKILDKVNGWKIYHLSTQMEDLADQEQNVYNQLTELLKFTEAEEGNGSDKEMNRINELIKGNLQRIKIINDGMVEAKSQIMKIFDHKIHITDIINRCASKRNFKKREKP